MRDLRILQSVTAAMFWVAVGLIALGIAWLDDRLSNFGDRRVEGCVQRSQAWIRKGKAL